MRILLLGSHMNYNLEHYVYMNLVKLGHEVKFYGYKERLGRLANPIRMAITRSKLVRDIANLFWLNRTNDEIREVARKFNPDFALSIKGEAVKQETVEWMKRELGVKTALWYPDDPRFFNSLVRYIGPSYDYVFTASEKVIPMYREIGCENVYFLPFACEPTIHRKLSQEGQEKYESDVVFVGSYTPRRARLIKALEKAKVRVEVYGPYWKYFDRGPHIHDGIYGPQMVKVFNRARIVLNIHVDEDLAYKVNMRTFEATGSGAFLLTDRAYGIERMFDAGKELVIYDGAEHLVKLISHYSNVEDERIRISTKAQERVHKEHTYEHRVSLLLNIALRE